MFSPETPQHSQYHHTKPAVKKDEDSLWWVKRLFQILFILLGVAAIAAMVLYGPKKKELVCDPGAGARGSMAGFGNCVAK